MNGFSYNNAFFWGCLRGNIMTPVLVCLVGFPVCLWPRGHIWHFCLPFKPMRSSERLFASWGKVRTAESCPLVGAKEHRFAQKQKLVKTEPPKMEHTRFTCFFSKDSLKKVLPPSSGSKGSRKFRASLSKTSSSFLSSSSWLLLLLLLLLVVVVVVVVCLTYVCCCWSLMVCGLYASCCMLYDCCCLLVVVFVVWLLLLVVVVVVGCCGCGCLLWLWLWLRWWYEGEAVNGHENNCLRSAFEHLPANAMSSRASFSAHNVHRHSSAPRSIPTMSRVGFYTCAHFDVIEIKQNLHLYDTEREAVCRYIRGEARRYLGLCW